MAFLTQLVQWGSTKDNAWHAKQSCTGWQLKASSPSTNNAAVLPEPQTVQTAAPEGASHHYSSQQQPLHSRQDAAAATQEAPPCTSQTGLGEGSQQVADRQSDLPQSQIPLVPNVPAQPGAYRQADTLANAATTNDRRQAECEQPTVSGNNPLGSSDFKRRAARSGDMYDARRTSLDHYLSPEASSSQTWQPEQDTVPKSSQETLPSAGNKGSVLGQQIDKNGERLTALLLNKLHGHAAHSSDQEEVSSPPALTSNDSGSMAGYRSPFESLASYGLPEEADSVQAEHGSSASLRMMPSIE